MLAVVVVVRDALEPTSERLAVPGVSSLAVEGVPLERLAPVETTEPEMEAVVKTLTVTVLVLGVCREEVVAHLEFRVPVMPVTVAEER